jgi:trans-aconitate 2-methyltransferase
MRWDVAVYEAFAAWRERPFDDLVARLPSGLEPGLVLDAGCGTGRTTHRLAARFPDARLLGVDGSEAMLRVAKPHPRITWKAADLRTFTPASAADVVVANAVLHWIPGPEQMLARLGSWVGPAGVLALQVPANFHRPSHRIVAELAASPRWSAHLRAVAPGDHVLPLAAYRAQLEHDGFEVEAWETDYLMELPGEEAVLNWLTGTTLRPYLSALPKGEAVAFRQELGARLAEAYPAEGGVTRFPFLRRFVVARRAAA